MPEKIGLYGILILDYGALFNIGQCKFFHHRLAVQVFLEHPVFSIQFGFNHLPVFQVVGDRFNFFYFFLILPVFSQVNGLTGHIKCIFIQDMHPPVPFKKNGHAVFIIPFYGTIPDIRYYNGMGIAVDRINSSGKVFC